MTLNSAHRISGSFLAIFIIMHLANHLVGLNSVDAHVQFMDSFRAIYRNIFVEILLMLAVCLQIYSGVIFAINGWKSRVGIIPWIQAGSGLYLAFFLLNHVGAIFFGRFALQLDTNFYFAVAGIHVSPFHFFSSLIISLQLLLPLFTWVVQYIGS